MDHNAESVEFCEILDFDSELFPVKVYLFRLVVPLDEDLFVLASEEGDHVLGFGDVLGTIGR